MNQRRFAITRPFASCWWRETKICDCGTYQAAFWRRLAFGAHTRRRSGEDLRLGHISGGVLAKTCVCGTSNVPQTHYFVRRRTPIVLFSQSARHNRKSPPGSRSPRATNENLRHQRITRSDHQKGGHASAQPLFIARCYVDCIYSAAIMASTLSLASPSSMSVFSL